MFQQCFFFLLDQKESNGTLTLTFLQHSKDKDNYQRQIRKQELLTLFKIKLQKTNE